MEYTNILIGALGIIFGLIIGLYVISQREFDEKTVLAKAEKLINSANNEKEKITVKAKENALSDKKQFEIEQQEFAAQLGRKEQALGSKEAIFQKRLVKINEIERLLKEEENTLSSVKTGLNELNKRIQERLIGSTGMSLDKAKLELLKYYDENIKSEAELRIQHKIEWMQECAVRDGKNMLAEVIYRFTSPASLESAQKVFELPRDELKGRIVGRGGRSIAFFENLFGVDVIFNDEPNTIIISCFNLVQREIAYAALQRLIREKNINEEIISRIKLLAEQDVEKTLMSEGENIMRQLDLKNMPADFVKLVGRLKFRTSYGQNIVHHSFEVAYFSRLLAAEVGANQHVAFLAGFFHDIGKAIDQEAGGSHDVLTKELLEKYGFPQEIVHAAWTHHNAAPQETIEARIVQAADAISASRPGARAESLDRYLAKIKELEETAISFEGVKKVYAINAGREVRVIVNPEAVDDIKLASLAGDIAGKVQEKGGYPGKIKITTIRTTKTTDYARK